MNQRHQSHLTEQIQRIIAGRTVRTDAHIDTGLQHLRDRSKSISQLHIAGRIRNHTYRGLRQQADILTSELDSYRRLLTPVLLQVCTIYLRTRGYSCQPEICWEEINLQDAVELANARLTGLQADQLQRQLEKKEEG